MTQEKGALRPKEAAAWLSISPDTLERLVKAGEIRTIKIGASKNGIVLIPVEELRRWLREHLK